MKTRIYRGIALVLCLLCLCSAAFAEKVAGINVIGVHHAEETPTLYIGVKTMSGSGAAVAADSDNLSVFGASAQVPLPAKQLKGAQLGHIIVVDTSMYYYKNTVVTTKDIQDIVQAYLTNLPKDERVMFVIAAEHEPVLSNYMTVEEAQTYASGIELGNYTSSCIYTSICKAFDLAATAKSNGTKFNDVFIVMDPDQESNNDTQHSLGEAVMVRTHSGIEFDVTLATPYRQKFLDGTNETRRQNLRSSFNGLANFCQQVSGRYVEIPQDNSGVDVTPLNSIMSASYGANLFFAVDCTELRNYIPVDGKMQRAPMSLYYREGNDQVVRTVEVQVNTAFLPAPDPTATPAPATTETPVPSPTSVVAIGQEDSKAIQLIHALYNMNYLDKKEHESFDSECYYAYIDFCQNNNLTPDEGVFEDDYHLILSGKAVAAVKVTPTPGPTPVPPEPTVPPEGFGINDFDTADNGAFIARMQTVLKKLNCYEEGVSTNMGRMDQATVDAVARYCKHYNWRNDRADGVTKQVCMEIITNGDKMTPIEPSLREKIKAFLSRDLSIGALTLKMWIPVALCAVLLFAIAVLIVALGGKKEKKGTVVSDPTPSPSFQPVPSGVPDPSPYPPVAPVNAAYENEDTKQPYFSKLITLTVEFKGRVRTEEAELKDDPDSVYTIGRKDCQLALDSMDTSASRHHAELYIKNNQVYVRDKSSHQNTYLNGRKVRSGQEGSVVNNGDRLQLSEHNVTVRW